MLPVKDYFATLRSCDFAFDWGIPGGIAFCSYLFAFQNLTTEQAQHLGGYFINFIAIIIGFSIASITIFSTSSNTNIDALKKHTSFKKVGGKKITLYQHMLANFMFTLIMSALTLVFNLVFYFLLETELLPGKTGIWEAINFLFILHIIFLTIRNMTNFYLVLWRKE